MLNNVPGVMVLVAKSGQSNENDIFSQEGRILNYTLWCVLFKTNMKSNKWVHLFVTLWD